MSIKKIMLLTSGLVPALSIATALTSCSCSLNDQPGEPITIDEPDNKQFKVIKNANIEEYIFKLSGFTLSRELKEDEQITATATLVSDDGDIPLSLETFTVENKELTISLSSKEWDELIAIQPTDTPYNIKNLCIKIKDQVLLQKDGGYSTVIKKSIVAKTTNYVIDLGGASAPIMYLPGGLSAPTAQDDEYFMWVNVDGEEESLDIDIQPINEDWVGFSATGTVNAIPDAPENVFYIETSQLEVRSKTTNRTALSIRLYNDNTEFYSNNGINPDDEIIWELIWAPPS